MQVNSYDVQQVVFSIFEQTDELTEWTDVKLVKLLVEDKLYTTMSFNRFWEYVKNLNLKKRRVVVGNNKKTVVNLKPKMDLKHHIFNNKVYQFLWSRCEVTNNKNDYIETKRLIKEFLEWVKQPYRQKDIYKNIEHFGVKKGRIYKDNKRISVFTGIKLKENE